MSAFDFVVFIGGNIQAVHDCADAMGKNVMQVSVRDLTEFAKYKMKI